TARMMWVARSSITATVTTLEQAALGCRFCSERSRSMDGGAMANARPLLSLVIIVKNEVRGIRETIESVKPFVDRYTILDTGSTAGTPAGIREAVGEVPRDAAG